ncbi:MAG TPA: LacI family DNA-binding transcriptional regulator [Acidimicrobiales bacterium]|nr:LacI family DNA-binding transcriptional regulator [Acidimicrobiales bacterium]
MTRPGGRRTTLEDVAARTGLSRATVSRVVNGSPRVSEAARTRVEAAVAELGFAPNRAARTLAGRRSETVALVVSEPSVRLFAEPFFAGTTLGVAAALATTPYQLVLVMVQDGGDRDRVEGHLLRGGADGALVLPAQADDPLAGRLAAAGIACVVAGRPAAGARVGFVDADNVGGARQGVSHLLAAGRRIVGTVAGPTGMVPGADRRTGWEQALRGAGRRPDARLVAVGDFSRAGGAAATAALLDRLPDLDGLFVASDLMALGALDALRAAGRRVPDDVAVVGFDDSELARSADPPLTTVRQPIEQLGRTLVELLLDQLDRDAPPAGVILRTDLVVRASA